MCRRAIEPRLGFWTLPAGFMENNETIAEGAAREAREEACAEVETNALIGVYNVARISQVQIFYRAKLVSDDIAVGPESAEVALFAWDDIPGTISPFQAFIGRCSITAKPKNTTVSFLRRARRLGRHARLEALAARYKND